MSPFVGTSKRSLRHSVKAATLLLMLSGAGPNSSAQETLSNPANYAWQAGAIRHAQQMRNYFDPDRGLQPTPSVIPGFVTDFDPSGLIATAQPAGETQTSQNAFFANLGTNGRTCLTCHQPQNGWSLSAAGVQARFNASRGSDPIFRLVDGATCPSDNISGIEEKLKAYSLLLNKGLIRIGLPVPATIPGSTAPIEYRIVSVSDPYGCNTNPITGLTTFGIANPTAGIVSVYRRPLPATNLGFLTAIMWDGREPTLAQQSIDATLGHAQANAAPTATQQQQIVNFESGLFTAQLYDFKAKQLTAGGAKGGPNALATLLPGFFIGINDPLGVEIRRACLSVRRSSICTKLGMALAGTMTRMRLAKQWRAVRPCSTARLLPLLAWRGSTTYLVWRAFPDFVEPVMTRQMSETTQSSCR